MSEICSSCGLPNELCVCETIAKEAQTITVAPVKRKFGKIYTQIQGFDSREINIKDLAKKLKSKLACGGTVKNNVIELQGDHRSRVKTLLIDFGFSPESIVIK